MLFLSICIISSQCDLTRNCSGIDYCIRIVEELKRNENAMEVGMIILLKVFCAVRVLLTLVQSKSSIYLVYMYLFFLTSKQRLDLWAKAICYGHRPDPSEH
jgi:hypothetical protein